MENCKTQATGKRIAHVGVLAVAILILAVMASAQQTPAAQTTAPAELSSPCVQLARRTHHNERNDCVPATRQGLPAGRQGLPAGRQGNTPAKRASTANLKLLGLAPVNPMALARTLRPPASKSSRRASTAQGSSVTELQVASGNSQLEDVTVAKKSKRTFLKEVHGEAYGSLAPGLDGGHAAGGAVGASSKSGKTHIFVETNHNRDSSSQ